MIENLHLLQNLPSMKKIYFALLSISVISFSLLIDSTTTYSNPTGAPAGCSSAPANSNATCAKSGCHSGTASARDSMITSDVAPSGYIPGGIYTITVSIAQAGISKWGFECSPQDGGGNVLGTLAITNSTQTQLLSSTYVTHKTAGNTSTTAGTKSWSFSWTAPAAGTGSVPFYASVMAANGNGNNAGDLVFKDTYMVYEDPNTGIVEKSNTLDFAVFPNPVEGNTAQVSFNANTSSTSRIRVMSLNGTVVNEINHNATSNGNQHATLSMENLAKGVYFVEVQNELGTKMTRIIRR